VPRTLLSLAENGELAASVDTVKRPPLRGDAGRDPGRFDAVFEALGLDLDAWDTPDFASFVRVAESEFGVGLDQHALSYAPVVSAEPG
jgi:hypothetical protein